LLKLALHYEAQYIYLKLVFIFKYNRSNIYSFIYEGWNFNSGNYLFTTDTK